MAKIKEDLPKPLSRIEQQLSYITKRDISLSELPKPLSRIEEYLEYLCYNLLDGAVSSVNGQTGVVTLESSDLGAIDNIEQTDNEIKLNSGSKEVASVDLSNFAKLNEKNTFKDILINEGIEEDNIDYATGTGGYDSSSRWMGMRNLSSNLFADGFVNKLRIFLTNNASERITGLNIFAVTKGNTRADDIVSEQIVTNRTYKRQVNGSDIYIEIDINRAFSQDTYFLFKTNGGNSFKSVTQVRENLRTEVVNITSAPSIGGNLNLSSNNISWVSNMAIVGKGSVKNIIEYISRLRIRDTYSLNPNISQPFIGELRSLVYDAGESICMGGNTWLRCDGQTITRETDISIFSDINNIDTITLPTSSNNEYLYVCVG